MFHLILSCCRCSSPSFSSSTKDTGACFLTPFPLHHLFPAHCSDTQTSIRWFGEYFVLEQAYGRDAYSVAWIPERACLCEYETPTCTVCIVSIIEACAHAHLDIFMRRTKFLSQSVHTHTLSLLLPDDLRLQTLNVVLGFLVIFRTQLAYARYACVCT
jgi:hypothetical protein